MCTSAEKTTFLGKDNKSIVKSVPGPSLHNLVYPPLFSVVKTVKEALAVCRSFLDGVVIFFS